MESVLGELALHPCQTPNQGPSYFAFTVLYPPHLLIQSLLTHQDPSHFLHNAPRLLTFSIYSSLTGLWGSKNNLPLVLDFVLSPETELADQAK